MLKPNHHIYNLPQPVHGGISYPEIASLGISPDEIIDFSVNSNPFGPPPGLNRELLKIKPDRYPDSDSADLIKAISQRYSIPADMICVGSGSTELIRAIAAAFFSPDDTIVIPQPAYSEYELACRLVNSRIAKRTAFTAPGFHYNLQQVLSAIVRYKPKGIFLCNPNNPTGRYIAQSNISKIAATMPDCLISIDEAYIAFTDGAWDSLPLADSGSVIILRSMTKDYALAGLRLGYAVAHPRIIATLKRVLPPWNVNAMAQRAGIFCLQSGSYIGDCNIKIRRAKEFLVQQLTGSGLEVVPSETNFFLVNAGNARAVRQALLKKKILVRDCTSFGLPEYIRISPRTMPECKALIAAMKMAIQETDGS